MSGLLPKRVVMGAPQVFCAECGSVMYVGRYRQTENHYTLECLANHCPDKGSVYKLPHTVVEVERKETTPTPQEPYS